MDRGAGSRRMLSIVIPAKDEAGNIDALTARLRPVLDALPVPSEVIFVDDGSRDGTAERIRACRREDRRIKLLGLSRNFGKDIAIAAGLRHASGQAVVVMDADLQHPPEVLHDLVARWREGAELVYAQRRDRAYQSPAKRWSSQLFYRLFARIGEIDLPQGVGDFALFDRKVVRALNAMPERTRFAKGLYAWVGFRQCGVPFDIAERHSGRTSWSLWKLWLFALDGLTAFSTMPLRVWSYVGLAVSALALVFGIWIMLKTLILGVEVPGYPSLMVAVSLFAGIQLITLGVLGEYLGRIFTEVKRRPLYLVREAVGLEPEAPEVWTGAPAAAASQQTSR